MDIILICRDALENSVVANVAMALEAKKAGQDAGILFTEEALAALVGQSFSWSPLFQNRDARIKISRNATAMGVEIANDKDNRWTDISRLLTSAGEAGIKLMACPIWSQILAVDGNLPPQLHSIDSTTLLKEFEQAKIVIGGF